MLKEIISGSPSHAQLGSCIKRVVASSAFLSCRETRALNGSVSPQRIRTAFASLSLAFICTACTGVIIPSSDEFPGTNYSAPNFGDAKPVEIKGRKPNTYPVHGVDVSRYNQTIDWAEVKRGGIEFAFIKATEGKDNVDPKFRQNWVAAAKLQRSAYHFYYFCATPEDQARNYIKNVSSRSTSLPPILDVEWNPKSPTCTKRPPKDEVVDVLKRFLDVIEKHYGQKPIIYTTIDFHQDNLADGALSGYTYWLRSVTAQPHHKYGGRPWTFWQYTGTGLAPGFPGPVDINVFRGTEAEWQEWVSANTR